jgi:hypothetical protein
MKITIEIKGKYCNDGNNKRCVFRQKEELFCVLFGEKLHQETFNLPALTLRCPECLNLDKKEDRNAEKVPDLP